MKTPVVQPAPPPAASVSEFIATFGIILAAIVVLLAFDTALARVDIRGRQSYAAREFGTGQQLLAQGQTGEAIEHLRTASTLDGENSAYRTALAQAILAAGHPATSEQILLSLLERNPTDGAANLAMARVLSSQGRDPEAKPYYHRAIYGFWPSGAETSRIGARFELIDLLARTDSKQELLAELLPIQDDSTNDAAQRKRIARLFVRAGSPSRAVPILRDVLRRDSQDADAYVTLADAALSLGDFAAARTNLVSAQKLMPEDSGSLKARISLTDSVIALDPTQRGLSLGEQLRRSRHLMQITLASARSCLAAQAPQVAAALDSSETLLVAPSSAEGQRQSIEQTLLLAGQLWGLRRTKCAPDGADGALALVHSRIAQ